MTLKCTQVFRDVLTETSESWASITMCFLMAAVMFLVLCDTEWVIPLSNQESLSHAGAYGTKICGIVAVVCRWSLP